MKNQIVKNIFLFSFSLLTIISISSCSNLVDDQVIPVEESCLVTLISDWNTGDTVQTFKYNNKKQLIETQDYTNGVKSTYNIYQYTSSSVTKIDYNADHTVHLKAVYLLNSKNAILKGSFYGGNNKLQGELSCFYNSKGQDILEVNKYGGETSGSFTYADSSFFYYENNNEVQVRYIQNGYTVDTIDTYYTYTNLIDQSHIARGNVLIPGFYGKDNKNILAQKTIPKLNIVEDYVYELNAKGYVSRSTLNSSGYMLDLKYTYKCNE